MRGRNATWWNFDQRVQWLANFLLDQRPEKVLVIYAHTGAALQLKQMLREQENIRAAVFNEELLLVDHTTVPRVIPPRRRTARRCCYARKSVPRGARTFQFTNQHASSNSLAK